MVLVLKASNTERFDLQGNLELSLCLAADAGAGRWVTEVCWISRAASTSIAPQVNWEQLLLTWDLNAETAGVSEQETLDYSLDLFSFSGICRKRILSVLLLQDWLVLNMYLAPTSGSVSQRKELREAQSSRDLWGQHLMLCFLIYLIWEAGMFASLPRISACFTQWAILSCASFSVMALKISILGYPEAGL